MFFEQHHNCYLFNICTPSNVFFFDLAVVQIRYSSPNFSSRGMAMLEKSDLADNAVECLHNEHYDRAYNVQKDRKSVV